MAHKTLIGGTAYEISGGKTLVDGTAYSIKSGKTLVGGTVYEVGFGGDKFVEIGVITTAQVGTAPFCSGTVSLTELPFEDMTLCNALLVNNVLYKVDYLYNPNLNAHMYVLEGFNGVTLSESIPFAFQITTSEGIAAALRSYLAGTYTVSLGISSQFS